MFKQQKNICNYWKVTNLIFNDKGTTVINSEIDREIFKIVLHEVLDVPGLDRNLISCSELESQAKTSFLRDPLFNFGQ